MDLETATVIVEHTFGPRPRLIDAIKTLRYETSLDLIAAKTYIDEISAGGKEEMFKTLCRDYVKDNRELLRQAREDRYRLDIYIRQLEEAIDMEYQE